jgi:hypothetical protein
MPSKRRKPAFLQSDIARVIRAAKYEGAAEVVLRADGTIVISLAEVPQPDVDGDAEFAL